jgi:hypothetical protein
MATIKITDKISLDVSGFTATEIPLAAKFAIDELFPSGSFPKLKSYVIRVTQEEREAPLYVTNLPIELILLNAGPNLPWQFTYQFAHELGHLAARAHLRFQKAGRHIWLEEALCGSYSVYTIDRMSRLPQPLGPNALKYKETYTAIQYSPEGVNSSWFAENWKEISAASTLTPTIMKISGSLAERFPDGSFTADNQALENVTLNPSLVEYLEDWKSKCGREDCVPAFLLELAKEIISPPTINEDAAL